MKIILWDQLRTEETMSLILGLCEGRKGTALTIGGFDGPHSGHESLFSAVRDAARKSNLASGIVTFTRSPGLNKKPFQYPGDVSTLNLRLGYFAEKGFDFVLLIDFSGEFGKMTGAVFFDILVKTVFMRYVAVGPDFRCGHRLDTGLAEISAIAHKEGFRFDSIQQVELDGQRISSSAVRKAIQSADFALAERLLGHPFLLDFTLLDWNVTGTRLDVPISSFTQILPRRGEYSVILSLGSGKSVAATLRITDSSVMLVPSGNQYLPEPKEILTVRFGLS
jgi:riboflavin kinase/FMN adenylyltransferase